MLGVEPLEQALLAGCREGCSLAEIVERVLAVTGGWQVMDDQTVLVVRAAAG
jgi:hypothetical protein